jgi:agmatine deiminase
MPFDEILVADPCAAITAGITEIVVTTPAIIKGKKVEHLVLTGPQLRIRQRTTDASGRPLEIIPLDQPARREHQGKRLDLSYVNFYLANGAVVLPGFGDPADQEALATLRRLYPEREVVQLPGLDIFKGGGGIHCITQQQPAGAPLQPF